MWEVRTDYGWGIVVFSGKRSACAAYLRQALKKGSPLGFLVICKKED